MMRSLVNAAAAADDDDDEYDDDDDDCGTYWWWSSNIVHADDHGDEVVYCICVQHRSEQSFSTK